jgi:pyruvate formate lyase activating enzyme
MSDRLKVNLGGIVPLSTVDWKGRAALVVFLRGCPLRCPHCHNQKLQSGESIVAYHVIASRIVSQVKGVRLAAGIPAQFSSQINLDDASYRACSKPFVDAFVLSGGEPLGQLDACARLFRLAKSLHLDTGLETSGYYPDRLEKLLEKDLVDKVFLDLKTALREPDYEIATGMSGVAGRVRESLEICCKWGVELETRSTIFPEMPSCSQVAEVAGTLLEMLAKYPENRPESLVLQQGQAREGEPRFEPVSLEALEEMAKSVGTGIQVQVRSASKTKWKN